MPHTGGWFYHRNGFSAHLLTTQLAGQLVTGFQEFESAVALIRLGDVCLIEDQETNVAE